MPECPVHVCFIISRFCTNFASTDQYPVQPHALCKFANTAWHVPACALKFSEVPFSAPITWFAASQLSIALFVLTTLALFTICHDHRSLLQMPAHLRATAKMCLAHPYLCSLEHPAVPASLPMQVRLTTWLLAQVVLPLLHYCMLFSQCDKLSLHFCKFCRLKPGL